MNKQYTEKELKALFKKWDASPEYYSRYQELKNSEHTTWYDRMKDFFLGKKTLPLTYDPFFKKIFNPDINPNRLSDFISALLGKKVRIVKTLQAEESIVSKDSLLIMDIVVELEDGSIADVEIQKVPYLFTGERTSCYSADLLMRQYARVKGKCRETDQKFTYKDLKKVYTIVLFEDSVSAFHQKPAAEHAIHYGKVTWNTGLQFELLQEYCFVALDIYKKNTYPKEKCERNAWLSLLTMEDISDMDLIFLQYDYPWIREICQEVQSYAVKPEEVLGMFSESLRILEKNSVELLVDQWKEEVELQMHKAEEAKKLVDKKIKEVEEKTKEVEEKTKEVEEKTKEVEEKTKEVEEQKQLAKEANQRAENAEQQVETERARAEEEYRKVQMLQLEIEELKKKIKMSRD